MGQIAKTEKKILDFIRKKQLLMTGSTVVVAVSGGADSLALLHILHRHRAQWGIQVVGAHLDHCLRGDASKQDRKLVMDYCAAAGIPLFSSSWNVAHQAAQGNDHNIEGAARTARYRFLFQVADICGGAVIATAHHQDDQAETILMHLLRGSGMGGLGGMGAKAGRLIRPFLGVTKIEILDYCAAYGLSYCTDMSNFDTTYLRNRIRLELIPLLKEYNPQVVSSLVNLGEICIAENDYLDQQTAAAYEKIAVSIGPERGTFAVEPFCLLPVPLQRRVLQKFFRMFQGVADKIGSSNSSQLGIDAPLALPFAAIESIRHLSLGEKFTLPGDILCSREAEQFVFSYAGRQLVAKEPVSFSYALGNIRESVVLTFPVAVCRVQITPGQYDDAGGEDIVLLEKSKVFVPAAIGQDMVIRSRKDGDVFSPCGMAGSMKLKKYFINEKVPHTLRDSLPLLANDREILWVLGKRFGNRCREKGEAIQKQAIDGWYITVSRISEVEDSSFMD